MHLDFSMVLQLAGLAQCVRGAQVPSAATGQGSSYPSTLVCLRLHRPTGASPKDEACRWWVLWRNAGWGVHPKPLYSWLGRALGACEEISGGAVPWRGLMGQMLGGPLLKGVRKRLQRCGEPTFVWRQA